MTSSRADARRGAKWPWTRAWTGPMSSSTGTASRLASRCRGSTSPSRASPSRPPSHLSSPATFPVAGRGMTVPNDRRVARSLRVVTRIWWTESNSSARTLGSSERSVATWTLR